MFEKWGNELEQKDVYDARLKQYGRNRTSTTLVAKPFFTVTTYSKVEK